MTRFSLILKSARYHWRANLGAVLASAAGCAVLVGALLVGDSVRDTLHTMAVERLGKIDRALLGQDRFFKDDLSQRVTAASLNGSTAESMLLLPGVCSSDANQLRANDVQICGITPAFWTLDNSPFRDELNAAGSALSRGEALVNEKLAEMLQVKAGDTVHIRIYKPGILPHDAPLGGRDDQAASLRAKIRTVIPARGLGRFTLLGNQTVPANIFFPISEVQSVIEQKGRANILLVTGENADPKARVQRNALPPPPLEIAWTLDDAQLKLRIDKDHNFAELSTARVFLDDPLTDKLLEQKGATGLATYFVNAIRANGKETPYSMVTAAETPLVDADMKDDEIVLNQWTADDLNAKIGDSVELEFFTVGLLRKMETKKAAFKVKAIVPLEGLHADLMPDFPGIANVDSTQRLESRHRHRHEKDSPEGRGLLEAISRHAEGLHHDEARRGALEKSFRHLHGAAISIGERRLDRRTSAHHPLARTP